MVYGPKQPDRERKGRSTLCASQGPGGGRIEMFGLAIDKDKLKIIMGLQ